MPTRLLRREAADVQRDVLQLEATLAACDGWDAKFEAFELACRFTFYGEPKPPPASSAPALISARFYPKFKPLREAFKAYEKRCGIDSVFTSLVPAVLHFASCSDLASHCGPDTTIAAPAAEGQCQISERYLLPRTHVHAWLCHAMLLNVPHGSPLDFYGGGKDPLFVSGARLAVQKIQGLLACLDNQLSLGGHLEFWRVVLPAPRADPLAHVDADALSAVAAATIVMSETEAYAADSTEVGGASNPQQGESSDQAASRHAAIASGGGATAALVLPSSASFGGGPVGGGGASDEEALCTCFGESLVALALLPRPMGNLEAILLHGLRRTAHASGVAHTFAFEGRARSGEEQGSVGEVPFVSYAPAEGEARPPATLASAAAAALSPPTSTLTLVAIDAGSPPGLEQFDRASVLREVQKAAVGFAALALSAAPGSAPVTAEVPPLVAAGLWGCGGFRGGQPLLRVVVLLLAAASAGVRLKLRLPPGYEPKFFVGVLAEVRKRAPTVDALLAAVCLEGLPPERRLPRLATDVPGYGSHAIRTLRGVPAGAGVASASGTAAEGASRPEEGSPKRQRCGD